MRVRRAVRHWQDGDADQRQAALNTTRSVFQKRPMIAAMKAAIAWQSDDPAWSTLRPPLVELDAQECRQLQDVLQACNFKMPEASSLAVRA